MTIEEIHSRGEISSYTYNVCIANRIKTFKELKLHYLKNDTFKNLKYCSRESIAELIEVYNKYKKYKDGYIEDEINQSVYMDKAEKKLKDIVTDFDDVKKATLIGNASLEELEEKLRGYWSKNREKEASQNNNKGASIEPIFDVADVVDLEETKQTIEDYWRSKTRDEAAENDVAEPAVKSASELPSRTTLEFEQSLKEYWKENDYEESAENDVAEPAVKSASKLPIRTTLELEKSLKKYWKENDVTIERVFGKHPSKKLNDLYSIKSYQGANPKDAKVIFVGRAPSWAADIEEADIFGYVAEYLTDGVAFCEKYAIHHPFLLRGANRYKDLEGERRRYHKNFSKLNLDSSAASKISFVELVGFPTTGMAGSNVELFRKFLFSRDNKEHLIELDKVLSNPDKKIFIAWDLMDDFKLINKRRRKLFKKFAQLNKRSMYMRGLNKRGNIFVHQHFSDAVGKRIIVEMEERVKGYLI